VVLAFAGRRAQSIEDNLDAVALRVRQVLIALRPSAIVGALADGADLLVVEAALGMEGGPSVHVILPTREQVFRANSVAPSWQERFDRALDEVRQRGSVDSLRMDDGPEAYRRANDALLERATELASRDERAIALVIARRGEGEMVKDLLARARLRNLPSVRIDPHVTITEQPRVFVAMPQGKKWPRSANGS
jgi:hypothetical protein